MTPTIRRLTARVLIASTLGLTMPLAPAQAGLIPTQAITQAGAQAERARVDAFLGRQDVQERLTALGVDAQSAKERVAALGDEEVARLAERLDQMPAGGSDVLGILFAVFIILLVTDILGFTKIFPFTRSVR